MSWRFQTLETSSVTSPVFFLHHKYRTRGTEISDLGLTRQKAKQMFLSQVSKKQQGGLTLCIHLMSSGL